MLLGWKKRKKRIERRKKKDKEWGKKIRICTKNGENFLKKNKNLY
jgi:hypothetical protein